MRNILPFSLIQKNIRSWNFEYHNKFLFNRNSILIYGLWIANKVRCLNALRRDLFEQVGFRLVGTGWKTPLLHINVTINLWRNYCSLLISFNFPSHLLSCPGSYVNNPLDSYFFETYVKIPHEYLPLCFFSTNSICSVSITPIPLKISSYLVPLEIS